ncbi:hypothetical protein [Neorhizobium sp. DT-125]|uniref:hypothetical protein n=1 Tax=Neorhizobium sp. DT-125 TaxID=3396163 RepID=UPI003F1D945E
MSNGQPSRFQLALTWLALGITALLLLLGVSIHGFSADVHQRFWADIFGRVGGPMSFRFFLQPAMALLAAVPDGLADARHGHSFFLWTNRGDPTARHGRLRQGLISTARVVLLGISMDVIYQLRMFDRFYPAEAVMMAILLAIIPYFAFRWIIERVAGWWFARKPTA